MQIRAAPDWADLVFHVLAHVKATVHLAPSLYDREYVTFAFRALGPSAERNLDADANVLGRVLGSHDSLARAELLAWLFASVSRARAASGRDLAELLPADVDRPGLLALVANEASVEILRCAAELEADAHARLPPPEHDVATLRWRLAQASRVAPLLAEHAVVVSRALRLRGRALEGEIWIGAPSEVLGPTLDHVAWQACHEATVVEVSRRAPLLSHDEREAAAVVLLAERARREGERAGHARWLAHFGVNAPDTDRTSLAAPLVAILDACLGR